MFSPQKYVQLFPEAMEAKKLYLVDIKEVRGKLVHEYQIYWHANTLTQAKRNLKAFAKKENIEIVSIQEVTWNRNSVESTQ